MCQVTIAGPKEGVASAKEAIKDITTKFYSTITHPGTTHAEFKVDEWQMARFCGRAGSNIKHIQGDSKAKVYVPREWSANKRVVVVGTPSQVAVATKHIKSTLEEIAAQAARVSSEEAMAASYKASKAFDFDDEAATHEDWMDEYMVKR